MDFTCYPDHVLFCGCKSCNLANAKMQQSIDTDCVGVFRQTRKDKSKCHQRRPASRAYRYKYWTADNSDRGEPVWPSGKALGW